MAEELDAIALADAVNAAVSSSSSSVVKGVAGAPQRLPIGWVTKESSTNPGFVYYYHVESGISSWHPPVDESSDRNLLVDESTLKSTIESAILSLPTPISDPEPASSSLHPDSSSSAASILQPTASSVSNQERPTKRPKTAAGSSSSSSNGPKEVRVLHILKKHKDSRRPSSWRQPTITQSLEEAKEELQGLLDILLEVEADPKELRATFEELARTESDCSSAKRGGDLGFFGRRKMQPTFEEASFGLEIGELTKELVETSSGVHLILRLG